MMTSGDITSRGRKNRSRAMLAHRVQRLRGAPPRQDEAASHNATLDCGWGRLLFAPTFESPAQLAEEMRREAPDQRDIAIYITDSQAVSTLTCIGTVAAAVTVEGPALGILSMASR